MAKATKLPPVDPPAAPPPGRSLREFALAELDRAVLQLGREGQARHAGVHQARKSMRRARATLALSRRALGEAGKRLDGDIARLCRGLSLLRDGQALVEALERLQPGAPPALQPRLPEAMALAAARRDALMARALERDPGLRRRQARIEALAARLQQLPWDELRNKHVARALERSERRVAKARRQVARDPSQDERWHVLRRRLRRLRQQDTLLQALDLAVRPVGGVPLDEATALGEAQDDALLLRHCGARSPFPADLRRELRALARARMGRVRSAANGA